MLLIILDHISKVNLFPNREKGHSSCSLNESKERGRSVSPWLVWSKEKPIAKRTKIKKAVEVDNSAKFHCYQRKGGRLSRYEDSLEDLQRVLKESVKTAALEADRQIEQKRCVPISPKLKRKKRKDSRNLTMVSQNLFTTLLLPLPQLPIKYPVGFRVSSIQARVDAFLNRQRSFLLLRNDENRVRDSVQLWVNSIE